MNDLIGDLALAPQQYPAVIRLGDLDGGEGFRIDGDRPYDELGFYGASAGDINGDGFDDMIVSAFGDDTHGQFSAGAAFVVYGKAGAFDPVISAADLTGETGFKITGAVTGEFLGGCVAGAGDVNGDGLDDMILGAAGLGRGGSGMGAAYVVFGRHTPFPADFDPSTLDGSNGFKLVSPEAADAFGGRVASAGDVNGDGFADLLIGAEDADPNGDRSGAGYVVFGHAGGFAPVIDVSTLDGSNGFRINGATTNDLTGLGAASAGDFNGDGIDDFMLGAPRINGTGDRPGVVSLVFGTRDGFPATLELSSLDGGNGFRIRGGDDFDAAGIAIGAAGDVNADGYDDLIIGASYTPPGSQGAAYVLFGRPGLEPAKVQLADLDGTDGFKLVDPENFAEFGRGATGAGDVNGDGFDDMMVGAPTVTKDGHTYSGAAYVIFGKASGFDPLIDVTTLDGTDGFAIWGAAVRDAAGINTAAAGDVNGDGLADIMVGAYGTDFGGDRSGSSYIIYGRAPDTAVDRTGTIASQTLVGGEFGDRLAGLGGDDALWGHGGQDKLFGSSGADTLTGGGGKDLLSGGAGADVFRFTAASDSPGGKQTDLIRDLDAADVIDLSAIDADPFTDRDQAFSLVARFHGVAGEVKAHYKAGHDLTVVQADIDGDGHADMTIKIAGDHEGFAAFVL